MSSKKIHTYMSSFSVKIFQASKKVKVGKREIDIDKSDL